jgi:uncharacterized protein (DUF1778 family)
MIYGVDFMAKKAEKAVKKTGRPPMFPEGGTRIGLKLGVDDRAVIEKAAALERRQFSEWCRLTLVDTARAVIAKHENAS